jgi:hypothetical protein
MQEKTTCQHLNIRRKTRYNQSCQSSAVGDICNRHSASLPVCLLPSQKQNVAKSIAPHANPPHTHHPPGRNGSPKAAASNTQHTPMIARKVNKHPTRFAVLIWSVESHMMSSIALNMCSNQSLHIRSVSGTPAYFKCLSQRSGRSELRSGGGCGSYAIGPSPHRSRIASRSARPLNRKFSSQVDLSDRLLR